MLEMNDIYHKVDTTLILSNYWNIEDEERKLLVDHALRYYLADKISVMDERKTFDELVEKSTIELLNYLEGHLSEFEKKDSLRHVIHYVINLTSNLQEYAVVWEESQDEQFIEQPLAVFDDNGKWDRFITHHETSYVKAFEVAYDVLQNKFSFKR